MARTPSMTADLLDDEDAVAELTRADVGLPEQPAPPPVVVVRDADFTPAPLDPAAVTGTPEQQLAVAEDAIHRANAAARETVLQAEIRHTIELGAAYRLILDRELYRAAGYTSVEAYATGRLGLANREGFYAKIRRAADLVAVQPLSEISDRPFRPSQARVLAPIIERHGVEAARSVVSTAAARGKVTAATLQRSADHLKYRPDAPRQEAPAGGEPELARRLTALVQAVNALREAHKMLRGTVIRDGVAADPVHGVELAREIEKIADEIGRAAVAARRTR